MLVQSRRVVPRQEQPVVSLEAFASKGRQAFFVGKKGLASALDRQRLVLRSLDNTVVYSGITEAVLNTENN